MGWGAAIAIGDILDVLGPAAHWSAATKRTNIEHYSRWLGYLVHIGHLDASESAGAPRYRGAYPGLCRSSSRRGCAEDRSVVAGWTSRVVIKAMAPHMDWRWLADACNALNRTSKPQSYKRPRMRPTEDIYAASLRESRAPSRYPLLPPHRGGRLSRYADAGDAGGAPCPT